MSQRKHSLYTIYILPSNWKHHEMSYQGSDGCLWIKKMPEFLTVKDINLCCDDEVRPERKTDACGMKTT